MVQNIKVQECEFSSRALEYLYNELPAEVCGDFEDHLAECQQCIDTLAMLSEAHFEVYEWNKLEFQPLPTPQIIIPENETSVFAGFKEFINSVRSFSLRPAFAFPALAMLLAFSGLVIYRETAGLTFDQAEATREVRPVKPANPESPSSELLAENKNSAEKDTETMPLDPKQIAEKQGSQSSDNPGLDNSRPGNEGLNNGSSDNDRNDGLNKGGKNRLEYSELTRNDTAVSTGPNPPKERSSKPLNKANKFAAGIKSETASKRHFQENDRLPSLSQFETVSDDSLRLADLLDEIGDV